jgi:putative salt-induced outer membrane protein
LILQAAETDANLPAGTWKGEGELGYSSTSGNSDSENLNASLGLTREANNWKHSVALESLQAKTDGETSVDRFDFRGRSEYGLGENSYVYGQLRYEDDEFSGYDYQASATVGAGSRLLATDSHRLDASAGVGVRRVKSTDDGKTDDEGIIGANLSYEYVISESASLTERLLIESGDQNTYSESETALKTRIKGALAAKISYLVKHNSEVPPGIENTDRLVTVSLVYGF